MPLAPAQAKAFLSQSNGLSTLEFEPRKSGFLVIRALPFAKACRGPGGAAGHAIPLARVARLSGVWARPEPRIPRPEML